MFQHSAAMSDTEDPTDLPSLTRNGYTRTERTNADIGSVLMLGGRELVDRFAQGRDGYAGYLTTEALVFFIRRASRSRDDRTLQGLFAHLFARCQAYFRHAVRGVSDDLRADIQACVLEDLVRVLLAPDDRADYLECRFWNYLRRRTITRFGRTLDAARQQLLIDDTADDDGEAVARSQGIADTALSPEDMALLREALLQLPPDLRELYILRRFEGWSAGDERRSSDPAEPTLAERFGVSPRAINKRLAKAEAILNSYRRD